MSLRVYIYTYDAAVYEEDGVPYVELGFNQDGFLTPETVRQVVRAGESRLALVGAEFPLLRQPWF